MEGRKRHIHTPARDSHGGLCMGSKEKGSAVVLGGGGIGFAIRAHPRPYVLFQPGYGFAHRDVGVGLQQPFAVVFSYRCWCANLTSVPQVHGRCFAVSYCCQYNRKLAGGCSVFFAERRLNSCRLFGFAWSQAGFFYRRQTGLAAGHVNYT